MQLYQHDIISNQSDFTVAVILLYGKDNTISRRVNLDRYDDRIIDCNCFREKISTLCYYAGKFCQRCQISRLVPNKNIILIH